MNATSKNRIGGLVLFVVSIVVAGMMFLGKWPQGDHYAAILVFLGGFNSGILLGYERGREVVLRAVSK